MKHVVRLTHWIDVDDGYTEGSIEVEVDADTEADAVESIRDEFPEDSWDAYVVDRGV